MFSPTRRLHRLTIVGQIVSRLTGYVEQNDLHLSTSTVRESLTFSAELRLPQAVEKKQREAFVEVCSYVIFRSSLGWFL